MGMECEKDLKPLADIIIKAGEKVMEDIKKDIEQSLLHKYYFGEYNGFKEGDENDEMRSGKESGKCRWRESYGIDKIRKKNKLWKRCLR